MEERIATKEEQEKMEALAREIAPALLKIRKACTEHKVDGNISLYGDGASAYFSGSDWEVSVNGSGETTLSYRFRKALSIEPIVDQEGW